MGEIVLDTPETHPVHPHKTGHHLFDFILGGSAIFISLVSLFVAVRHGETMEKLVKVNSYPNIEFATTFNMDAKTQAVSLDLALNNTGVGPARIETLQLS